MEFIREFINYNQYGLPTFIVVMIIIFILMWLAVVFWVTRDITTRTQNILVIIFSIVLVAATNLFGLVAYLLIRPSQTIGERQQHDLFYHSILDKDISFCAHCHESVRNEYKHCPSCGLSLENKCTQCHEQLNPAWDFCVSCGHTTREENGFALVARMQKLGSKIISLPKRLAANVSARMQVIVKSIRNIKVTVPRFQRNAHIASVKPRVEKVQKVEQKKSQPPVDIIAAIPALGAPIEASARQEMPPVKLNKDGTPRKARTDAGKSRGSYKKRRK